MINLREQRLDVYEVPLIPAIEKLEDKKKMMEVMRKFAYDGAKFYVEKQQERLSPMIFLSSENTFFSGTLIKSVEDIRKDGISIIGAYAKDKKCFCGIVLCEVSAYLSPSHTVGDAVAIINIAYDESLVFSKGVDMKEELYEIAIVKEKRRIINKSFEKHVNFDDNFYESLRKPIENKILVYDNGKEN